MSAAISTTSISTMDAAATRDRERLETAEAIAFLRPVDSRKPTLGTWFIRLMAEKSDSTSQAFIVAMLEGVHGQALRDMAGLTILQGFAMSARAEPHEWQPFVHWCCVYETPDLLRQVVRLLTPVWRNAPLLRYPRPARNSTEAGALLDRLSTSSVTQSSIHTMAGRLQTARGLLSDGGILDFVRILVDLDPGHMALQTQIPPPLGPYVNQVLMEQHLAAARNGAATPAASTARAVRRAGL